MNRALVYGIFTVFGGAMLLLLVGFAGWQFGLVWLAAGLYAVAVKSLWIAFILLLLWQAGWSLNVLWQGLVRYFRREAMAMRRVARLQMHYRDVGQRLMSEKRQLHYHSQMKRQRILLADDKRHSGELYDAIDAELRDRVSPEAYRDLRKTLKKYHKRADARAMLALRRQVLCQSSVAG
jgi:hypothetical protein